MEQVENRFEYGVRLLLYIMLALLPLWIVPRLGSIEFAREITFGILTIAAFILWLLSLLTTGTLRYQYSPILYAAGALVIAGGISAFFSPAPLSAFLGEPIAEKVSTLLMGVVLMVLAGSVFRSSDEIKKGLLILCGAGGVSAVITALQLLFHFVPWKFFIAGADGIDFNAIGTLNGLAIFYVTILMVSLGLLFSWREGSRKWQYALCASMAFLLLDVLLINFQIAWMILVGVGIFALGLIIKNIQLRRTASYGDASLKTRMDWRYAMTLGLLALGLFMIIARKPFFTVAVPLEVSPTFSTTLTVARSVFKEGIRPLLLGSGPTTFGLDWSRYKDASINQTVFWNIRFSQGSSWFSTMSATTGLIGLLVFLGFFVITVFFLLKSILISEENSVGIGLFLGFMSLTLASFVYSANTSFIVLLFISIGFLTVRFKNLAVFPEGIPAEISREVHISEREAERKSRLWTAGERIVHFEGPWELFLSSLLVIFALFISIAGFYFEMGRARSALAQQSGVQLLQRGDIDGAVRSFENAVSFEDQNFQNYVILLQARMEKIKQIVQRASQGQNVQQEFQSEVSVAIQNADRAVILHPREPIVWRTRGAFYELLLPFIQGSERLAFENYRKAAEFDPLNPTLYVDAGRTALASADRIQLLIQQGSGKRDELTKARAATLEEAERQFKKAAEMKPDYAQAHFLLAQTLLRGGNLQAAIQSVENTKILAPFDIGVAFQLGLLYYQANNMDRAETEFQRALSISANYSNARYFLGLIYDRKKDKERALKEFEEVEKLNPDNQEIKKIVVNLKAGKPALSGIVPPAEPPEKRKEIPVREERKNL